MLHLLSLLIKYLCSGTTGKLRMRYSCFYLGRIGSLVAEIILMHLLTYTIGVDHRLSKVVVAVIVVVLNYVISKLVVFRK